jgi:hypothetical protein
MKNRIAIARLISRPCALEQEPIVAVPRYAAPSASAADRAIPPGEAAAKRKFGDWCGRTRHPWDFC